MSKAKSLIIKILIIISMISLSFYMVMIVKKLDILPDKYLVLFYSVIGVLNLLGAVTLLIKKWYTKIFTCLIYVCLVAVSVVGIKYGTDTLDFLDKSFNNNTVEITAYNIVTLSKYEYDSVEDVNNKDLTYLENDAQIDAVKEKLDKVVTVNYLTNPDLILLYESLIKEEVEFVLLDEAYLDILAESYKDIDDVIEVLYTIEIETKIEVNYDEIIKLEPTNIYLSGSDGRGALRNKSRSDVNMLITINPDTKTILLTSIPRDYYVDVYGKTGLKDKLTHAGIYGIETSRKTVENLFETEIAYSIKTGFSAVVEVVDLVGGITVYSDKTFNSSHMRGWKVKEGDNEMDGAKALAYSRERYAYLTGDRHRIKNQQQVLAAVIDKATKSPELLMKYDQLLESLSKFYVTDIPRGLITEVVKLQLDENPTWTIISQSVSGSDASLPTYTAPNSKRYVMIPFEKDLKEAKEKITSVLNGD